MNSHSRLLLLVALVGLGACTDGPAGDPDAVADTELAWEAVEVPAEAFAWDVDVGAEADPGLEAQGESGDGDDAGTDSPEGKGDGEAAVAADAAPGEATGWEEAAFDPCAGVVCVGSLPASLGLSGGPEVYRVSLAAEGFFMAHVAGGTSPGLRLLGSLDPEVELDAHPTTVGAWLPAGECFVEVQEGTPGGTLDLALTTPQWLVGLGIDPELAADALAVFRRAWEWGATRRPEYLVVDFTWHSALEREWVLDLSTGELLWRLRVAHGWNSTDGIHLAYAVTFSNVSGSHQSSLGLYRLAGPYTGTYGPSLRLEGLEPGFNDAVCERDIVFHPWSGVSDEYAERCGFVRPSWGCPAINDALSPPVTERLARPDGAPLDQGVAMLVWYPGTDWHAQSPYLHADAPGAEVQALQAVECDSSYDGTPDPPLSTDYPCY
jgi:hypothetical protein